jgi:hypothetical protein
MLEVVGGQSTILKTFIFPFMPVICVFLVSFLMLDDLNDDDDDGGGGMAIPAYNPI